mmetsp:Transcript_125771/g.245229  ORF Transcript_125771/g.245229 Transcript_125771/m.245229 type:complete len:96 (+) Transcript_125771:2218-2505(+)
MSVDAAESSSESLRSRYRAPRPLIARSIWAETGGMNHSFHSLGAILREDLPAASTGGSLVSAADCSKTLTHLNVAPTRAGDVSTLLMFPLLCTVF